jgi:tetratricopeptide (TPR) repeat protein
MRNSHDLYQLESHARNLMATFEREITRLIGHHLREGRYGSYRGQGKVVRVEGEGLGQHQLYLGAKMAVLKEQLRQAGRDLDRAFGVLYSGFNYLGIRQLRNDLAHTDEHVLITNAQYQEFVNYLSRPEFRTIGLNFDPAIEGILAGKVASDDQRLVTALHDEMGSAGPVIPNNLKSEDFEHRRTGFVGRHEDLIKLDKLVFGGKSCRRAIVAPGGIGKTALALEFLDRVRHLPNYADELDAIIFYSLKSEFLHWNGIKTRNVDATLEGVKADVHARLCETLQIPYEGDIRDLENKRVLVCIDNLEDLLVDRQNEFEAFFEDHFPQDWKYLLTSRITVESFTAHRLEQMSPADSKVLCQEFFDLTSYNFTSDAARNEGIAKIASNCRGVPLAIKFAVDSVAYGGKEIPTAIEQSIAQILEFSYKNFVENLGEDTVATRFISALYALEREANRASICEIGEIDDVDDFAQTFHRLSRLSLCTRDDETNTYQLSETFQDVITKKGYYGDLITRCRRNLNAIKIKVKDQKLANRSRFDLDYTGGSVPESLLAIISGLPQAITEHRNERIRQINSDLRNRKDLFEDSVDFQYNLGITDLELRLYSDAKDRFHRALAIDPEHHLSTLMLGRAYRKMHDLDDALRVLLPLSAKGYGNAEMSSAFFAETLIRELCRTLVYLRRYEAALEITSGWKDSGSLKRVMAVSHTLALRRYCEELEKNGDFDPEKLTALLDELMETLDFLLTHFSSEPDVEHEAIRTVERAASILYTRRYLFKSKKTLYALAQLLEKFGRRLDDVHPRSRRIIESFTHEIDHGIDLDVLIRSKVNSNFYGRTRTGDTCFISGALKSGDSSGKSLLVGYKAVVRAVEAPTLTSARYRAFEIVEILPQ